MSPEQFTLFAEAPDTVRIIAGVDEAGRGCLAGPVTAGAVILPASYDLPGLNDSKKLTAEKREALFPLIKEQAVAWAVGQAWPAEIDKINILQATFSAMSQAVRNLRVHPNFLLIDGDKTIPDHFNPARLPQKAIVGGDGLEDCISAASIMAKTFRDKLMVKLGRRYPGYGLEKHMGYGTKDHLAAIVELGPCPVHRMTFRGVKPPEKKKESSLCLPGI